MPRYLLPDGIKEHFVDNKPNAARLVHLGQFDSCIASKDVVEQYPNLQILEELHGEMVWVQYANFRH